MPGVMVSWTMAVERCGCGRVGALGIVYRLGSDVVWMIIQET